MKREKLLPIVFLLGFLGSASAQNFWKPVWVPVNVAITSSVDQIIESAGGNLYVSSDSVYVSLDSGSTGAKLGSMRGSLLKADQDGTIYAGNRFGGLYRFNPSSGEWENLDTAKVLSYDVSLDGKLIVIGSSYVNCILISTDSGSIWHEVPSLDSSWVNCVRIETNGRILVSALSRVAGSYLESLFISADSGNTWQRAETLDSGLGISDIAFVSPSTFYAVDGEHFLVSADSGKTWTSSAAPFNAATKLALRGSSIYMLSDANLLSSNNGGTSWDTLYNSYDAGAVCVASDGEIFLGTGSGFYYSKNNATSWTKGFVINTFLPAISLAVGMWSWSHDVYVGTADGIFKSTDDGNSWASIGLTGETANELVMNYADSLFAVTETGLYRTEPSTPFVYWEKLGQDSLLSYPGQLAIDSLGTIFFAGFDMSLLSARVILSTDNGEHWKTSFQTPHVEPVVLLAATSTHVYAIFDSIGVFRTTDNGTSWTTSVTGLPFPGARSIAYNGEYLFSSMSGLGVFRSSEDVVNWSYIGLQSVPVTRLAVDPEGGVYATALTDLYYSSDNGDTWKKIDSSSKVADLATIAINGDNYAFELSQSGQIFRSSDKVTAILGGGTDVPARFSLAQNYPNPFNPGTAIRYHLSVASTVTLEVFDVLGRLVATLVNRKENAGDHSINFDGSRLPSGVYFYRLQAGSFTSVKKMILMK